MYCRSPLVLWICSDSKTCWHDSRACASASAYAVASCHAMMHIRSSMQRRGASTACVMLTGPGVSHSFLTTCKGWVVGTFTIMPHHKNCAGIERQALAAEQEMTTGKTVACSGGLGNVTKQLPISRRYHSQPSNTWMQSMLQY